jgi:hypothetical protein
MKITDETRLDSAERAMMITYACFLKATGASYTTIGHKLGVTRAIARGWFDDPDVRSRVAQMSEDMVGSAVKFFQQSTLEMAMTIAEIARASKRSDPATALRAAESALDRAGISKVNKSESVVKNQSEVGITDETGISLLLEAAPPEVAQAAAQHIEDAIALLREGTNG